MDREALKQLMIFVFIAVGGAALVAAGTGATAGESMQEERATAEAGAAMAPRGKPLHPDPAVDYLLRLGADDYATHEHPRYGFSFTYPKDFEVAIGVDSGKGEEWTFDAWRSGMPLAMQLAVYPLNPEGELFMWLALLPEDYDLEPPEGAQSNAVGWIDENYNGQGEHRSNYWFAANDKIFEMNLYTNDLEWLQEWMPWFIHGHFTLTPPSREP